MYSSVYTLTTHRFAPSCFFSYSDEKKTAELDKKQKLTEKPDLNDIMNIVAAKMPGNWELVGTTIYMYM